MASSSRQGGQPPSGSDTTRAGGRWREQFGDGATNSEDSFPLQTLASDPAQSRRNYFDDLLSYDLTKLSISYDDVAHLAKMSAMRDEWREISHRFGLLQFRLRKQDGARGRRSRSGNSDAKNAQHSSRTSIRQQLITHLEEKLSEYDPFLQSQDLRIVHSLSRSLQKFTLGTFLLDGPPIHGNFDHPLWMPYTHAVKRLLLDPGSRSWLVQDVDIFFDIGELMGSVEMDDNGQKIPRDVERQYDEEAQNAELPVEAPRQAPSSWRRIRTLLFNRLFVPLATAVCIFNITTALGYVMLMNDPAPPKPSYITGTLVTWFLTTGMMICHGILNTGSMKDYARRLVILATFTCFVVTVVFHFAGASNFASSFLVGITIAILLIQIW